MTQNSKILGNTDMLIEIADIFPTGRKGAPFAWQAKTTNTRLQTMFKNNDIRFLGEALTKPGIFDIVGRGNNIGQQSHQSFIKTLAALGYAITDAKDLK